MRARGICNIIHLTQKSPSKNGTSVHCTINLRCVRYIGAHEFTASSARKTCEYPLWSQQ